MKHYLLLGAMALCLSSSIAVAQSFPKAANTPKPPVATDVFWNQMKQDNKSQVLDAACCKVCRKGKACGDSCINRSYTCHKGVGCACNG